MNFTEELARLTVLIDQALLQYLPAINTYPAVIYESMHYSVFAGGKRLRPALVLSCARAVGGREKDVLKAACAIELLHTYSLIHDDLPAMDDDDLRRGKPTNHKVFGEATAILAGDSLLTMCFELLAFLPVESELKCRVIGEISQAAGVQGLISGQVMDLTCAETEMNLQTLNYIHTCKTGALFKASARAGAILAKASEESLALLTIYAEKIGLAFQIIDDILDIEGNEDKIGKLVGSDLKNQKTTYPVLLGLDEARIMAHQMVIEAREILAKFGREADFLRELAGYILHREC